jgi:hypothetical protein
MDGRATAARARVCDHVSALVASVSELPSQGLSECRVYNMIVTFGDAFFTETELTSLLRA